MNTNNNNALLLVISAPSGAGKSTLCNRLIEQDPTITYSISCTTRVPRGQEKDHEHYHFLSEKEFSARIANDEFIEYANVHGHFYGTLKQTLTETLNAGHDMILDIDVQGASQIRKICAQLPTEDAIRKGAVDIFISPPSMEELERRLCERATDSRDTIEKRMHNAKEEMKHSPLYQHIVINNYLNDALQHLVRIVREEHQKRR